VWSPNRNRQPTCSYIKISQTTSDTLEHKFGPSDSGLIQLVGDQPSRNHMKSGACKQWRYNLQITGTEPKIKINTEGADEEHKLGLLEEQIKIILTYESSIRSC
jgi:phosphomannomutase